jgi:hypothetical protein
VEVKLLPNGKSITQVKSAQVIYYHVELPMHAVILAEGLPVESYLEIGDHVNVGDHGVIRLRPDIVSRLSPDAALIWQTASCAELVLQGHKRASIRRWVNGHAPVAEPSGGGALHGQ